MIITSSTNGRGSGSDSLALQCVRTDHRPKEIKSFSGNYIIIVNRSGICDDVYSYLVDKRKLSEDDPDRKIFSFSNYQDITII